jgi:integrase/recombinase XerD
MATGLFRSPLAPRLEAFQESRCAGRRGVSTQKLLRYLDRFLARELKPGQTITREVAERWMESIKHLSTGSRINRISVLRQFCRYLSYFHPRTYTVPKSWVPRRTRLAPHIYTRGDVCKIMAEARLLGPAASLRPVVVSNLIGLLYATGIRIGEGLKLTLADLDLKRRLLLIREGKFGKSRYVPLSPSTASHLASYLRQRRKAGFSTTANGPLFVNLAGRKYGHPLFATVFLEVVRKIGLRGPKGQPGPRIHDLRHAYAVHRLLTWYRQGANLAAKLPLLATYLGHTTVTGTAMYLHATAQLLENVDKRFHAHFAVPPSNRKKTYGPN